MHLNWSIWHNLWKIFPPPGPRCEVCIKLSILGRIIHQLYFLAEHVRDERWGEDQQTVFSEFLPSKKMSSVFSVWKSCLSSEPGRPKIILNALSCFSMLAKNGGIFSSISTLFLRTNNYDLFHIKPFINVGDGAFSSEGSSLKRLIIKQQRK